LSNNLILLQINLQHSKNALAPAKIIKEMNYMYVTFLTLIQLVGYTLT